MLLLDRGLGFVQEGDFMKKEFLVFSLIFFSITAFGCISSDSSTKTISSPTPFAKDVLRVQEGDLVSVDYVGSFDSGEVFDTSVKEVAQAAGLPLRSSYAPLEFKVGEGKMIKGFEKAVLGMSLGEEKTVRLSPQEAYGERNESLVHEVSIDRVPNGTKEGMTLYTAEGYPVTVVKVKNNSVVLDLNNPMAGKHLTFKIIVRKIERK